MTRLAILSGLAGLALLPAAAQMPAAQPAAMAAEPVTVQFADGAGVPSGTATLTQLPTGVFMAVEVRGLPAGQWVAFHVHENGICDAATHHNSAGGHFNPTGVEHGYMTATGPHAGDMPNQWVDGEGVLRAQVLNTAVSLDGSARGILGRSVMIHAKGDDYSGQPSGNAGDRLGCAEIPAAG